MPHVQLWFRWLLLCFIICYCEGGFDDFEGKFFFTFITHRAPADDNIKMRMRLSYFSQNIDTSCKLSPLWKLFARNVKVLFSFLKNKKNVEETISIECQSLFFGIKRENIVNLSKSKARHRISPRQHHRISSCTSKFQMRSSSPHP